MILRVKAHKIADDGIIPDTDPTGATKEIVRAQPDIITHPQTFSQEPEIAGTFYFRTPPHRNIVPKDDPPGGQSIDISMRGNGNPFPENDLSLAPDGRSTADKRIIPAPHEKQPPP